LALLRNPPSFSEKPRVTAEVGLELGKSFEALTERFIDENPDLVASEEIAMFFDQKSGKQKPFVHDPDEDEIGELEADGEGGLIERLRVKTKAPQKEITFE
jgi:hypothetical protein